MLMLSVGKRSGIWSLTLKILVQNYSRRSISRCRHGDLKISGTGLQDVLDNLAGIAIDHVL